MALAPILQCLTCIMFLHILTVPWLRLLSLLSPTRPGFNPRPVYVGCTVYEVALRQVFFDKYFGFSLPVSFHQYCIIIHLPLKLYNLAVGIIFN